jgi:hypothetical protein
MEWIYTLGFCQNKQLSISFENMENLKHLGTNKSDYISI